MTENGKPSKQCTEAARNASSVFRAVKSTFSSFDKDSFSYLYKIYNKLLYYIFDATLMLFLVIFEGNINDIFLRGNKSFRTLKRTMVRQKYVTS